MINPSKNEERSDVFLPPSTIGILGGGQLGRMMALEAREMGYRVITLDPTEDSPCGQVADRQIVARFDSLQGAKQLAQSADVITYEFENIGAQVAELLENESTLPQGYTLLYTIQNRLREKKAIEQAGISVAPYRAVRCEEEVDSALHDLGYPVVLKTTEGGYDGKGQWVIRSPEEVHPIKKMLKNEGSKGMTWVMEAWVPFKHEISCIVARNARGECQPFPIAENIHQENILHLSVAPARISEEIRREATRTAVQLAESMQLIGLLAIEMFVLDDGMLYVNELAPRPHNSGHYTQQACLTSQFEQHIRAICNLPLGDVSIKQPTVMVNILGEHLADVLHKLPNMDPSFKVHLYGKAEVRPKRKMGHLNVVADDVHTAIEKIQSLHIWNMEAIQ